MIKGFPIEFIQKTLTQVLLEEHNKDNEYFGGDNQILISSFYEQLKTQEEVDRFTDVYMDLVKQQNKTQLIGNGILTLPDNPTYTNLYSAMIIPMTWACSIRSQIKNRDQMIFTINNLTDKLKGKKVDIAQLDVIDENERHIGVPFVVGTIGHNEEMPELKNGDYIGALPFPSVNLPPILNNLVTNNVIIDFGENLEKEFYLYAQNVYGKLKVVKLFFGKGSSVVNDTASNVIMYDERYIQCSILLDRVYEEYELYQFASAYISLYGDETVVLQLDNGTLDSITTETVEDETFTKVTLVFDLGENANTLCPGFLGTYDVEEVEVYKKEPKIEWLEDDGTLECPILFPPEHDSFEKYKLSLSFDSIKCNEPRTLNGEAFCDISFGGSATLVNENVALGNDLVKVGIKRNKIVAETPITYNDEYTWLEPLEMPSGNNPSTQPLQLLSNKMLSNTQTDSVSVSIQYSFIADMGLDLLKDWFKYARYGRIDTNKVSPNIIYDVVEYWSSWGVVEAETYLGKIADNIEIDNTESDTLTIAISMQVQGENN